MCNVEFLWDMEARRIIKAPSDDKTLSEILSVTVKIETRTRLISQFSISYLV